MSEKSSNKLDKRRKSISDGPSSGRSVRSDPNTSGKKKPNRRDGSTKSKSEATIIKAGAKAELDIPISSSRPSTDSSSRRGSGKNNTVNNNQASERGSLKRKRSKNDLKKNNKAKYKPKQRQRTLNEKFMKWMGFSVGNITVSDPRAIEAVVALDLQPHHLRKLRKKFDKIDIDGSGNIDYDEFFESVGELRSPFTDKLFALIDLDGSGTIEFDEYVRVMATYCMFTKDEIMRFCFECFDVDRSGTIDEKEFVELCKCINNASPTFPSNFKRALEEFDVNKDGLIDYGEFIAIDSRYPLMFFPAFRLQDMMQKNSLGNRGWVEVIENYRRKEWLEQYKAEHGGRLPPDPPLKAITKAFFPCCYKEKVHITVGADMEARHRNN